MFSGKIHREACHRDEQFWQSFGDSALISAFFQKWINEAHSHESLSQSSNPNPAKIRSPSFSTRAVLVLACLAAPKYKI
jgi:hypothetical protein